MILLAGATGYVGGHLLTALQLRGFRVRCLARRPEAVPRMENVEAVRGDVLDPDSLRAAMRGVETAYYLVHSMSTDGSFERKDREAAVNFGTAARRAGVRRIIYLGGLGGEGELSPHLASRRETGQTLRDSGVPTIEFRASIILGAGSLSFELIRALVHRLPVLVTPRWTRSLCQPVGIGDVIEYLVQGRSIDESKVFEIGGRDTISYQGLMKLYSGLRGLRRLILPVPVLTPWLSSLWLALVTPLYARVGRALIESVRHDTVIRDLSAQETFTIRPLGVREAMHKAFADEDRTWAAIRWSDPPPRLPVGRVVEVISVRTDAEPSRAFEPIRELGGPAGWYYAPFLWALRGGIDRFVGGPGMNRRRKDSGLPAAGDRIGGWMVLRSEPDRLLQLQTEMRLPGRAWLQFEVVPADTGARVIQTAIFEPWGFQGILYWKALYPVHRLIFRGMLHAIRRRGAALKRPQSKPGPA